MNPMNTPTENRPSGRRDVDSAVFARIRRIVAAGLLGAALSAMHVLPAFAGRGFP